LWIVAIPLLYHDGVWPMAQWHIASHHDVDKRVWHHGCMLWMKTFTIFTHHGIPMLSLLIMPKGTSTAWSKSLSLPPFYPTNCQLSIMHVTCPNGCNMHEHWLYLNPPSFIYNAFSFLQDYMAKHCHFLMFVACEKNMLKTSMYQDKRPNIM